MIVMIQTLELIYQYKISTVIGLAENRYPERRDGSKAHDNLDD
jgi:hypothetical protein